MQVRNFAMFLETNGLPWVMQVFNFSMFLNMIQSQKVMSPAFPAGNLFLRVSVYQSMVNVEPFLSMCMETKDTDESQNGDRTCWSIFKMTVHGLKSKGKDSYGRFAAKADKTGENTSHGWNDFMPMTEFLEPANEFLVDGSASFTAHFNIIKVRSFL
jgi:hypothetical protein